MLTVDISMTEPIWEEQCIDISKVIDKAARHALMRGAFIVPSLQDMKDILLSVDCSNDVNVRKLNAEYRDKDQATNVLSFPQLTEDMLQRSNIPVLLGDIILAFETIKQEAEEQNKSMHAHTSHLVVHGVLHLLGFDHLEDKDADMMEGLESDIVQELGYADPYF